MSKPKTTRRKFTDEFKQRRAQLYLSGKTRREIIANQLYHLLIIELNNYDKPVLLVKLGVASLRETE